MKAALLPLTLRDLVEVLQCFPFKQAITTVRLKYVSAQRRGSAEAEPEPHLVVGPHGVLHAGGDWSRGPAAGRHGEMPFVIGIVRDEASEEPLDGHQRSATLQVVARVQKRFNLALEQLDRAEGKALFSVDELRRVRAEVEREKPFSPTAQDPAVPLDESRRLVSIVIDQLRRVGGESRESGAFDLYGGRLATPPAAPSVDVSPETREIELSPGVLQELRPHVINLVQGRFSTDGEFQTSPEDVDAIFSEHLVNWARSRPADATLPIVIYAHGGLVSEHAGLGIAATQVQWWKDNGAYPLHFVWETGLFETLGQILNPNRERALDFAAPTDFLLETLARHIGGVAIWSGMKRSAERASDAVGGARFVARKLAAFCGGEFGARIELHAVGHSAGSIFHAHFIPAALEEGAPPFASLQLLAPAVRVDTFAETLLPRIGAGKGVERLAMFTMARPFELDDNCAIIYRKSLLCLIRAALEPQSNTPILGLEESLRANSALKRLFNLDGAGAGAAEVVFSKTNATTGRSASTSTTHGGFDNDVPTMNSVARRILDRDDIISFPAATDRAIVGATEAFAPSPMVAALLDRVRADGSSLQTAAASIEPRKPSRPPGSNGGVSKRALCVGIDRYPTAPLGGCVNDARQWEQALTSLGFATDALHDEQATRDVITAKLENLIRTSRPGDTVVFQYSGHGTQLQDLDGDEPDSFDEALCPIDFAQGHFIIDDDLARIFTQIPEGVNVTVFTDCCHSGTITRLAVGTPTVPDMNVGARARFVVATAEMEAAHRADRSRQLGGRGVARRNVFATQREVLFAACRASEVAMERSGHGDFTTRAVPLLVRGAGSATNAAIQEQILRAFGPNPQQHPELHCAPVRRTLPFLGAPAAVPVANSTPNGVRDRQQISDALRVITEALASD
jgi:hypothetical protein